MWELEELLSKRDQLEKEIEGGFRYEFRTIHQISAGWDDFYRIEGQTEETELIIRKYSQLVLELSSFSLRLEQMRDISNHLPERRVYRDELDVFLAELSVIGAGADTIVDLL